MIKVSVIVVTGGIRKSLAETLASITNQTFKDFELLVVSSPSTFAKSLAKKHGARYFEVPFKNIGKSRNFGVKKSKGEVIVFTDDDCVAERTWLKELLKPLGKGAMASMGKTLPVSTKTLSERLATLDFYLGRRTNKLTTLITCNCAIKREIFNHLSFSEDTETCEDYGLGRSIHSAGHRIQYAAAAIVHHHHLHTLPKYFKRIFAYGRDFSVWASHEQLPTFTNLDVMFAMGGVLSVLGLILLVAGFLIPAILLLILALLFEVYPYRVYFRVVRWQISGLPFDIGNFYIFAFFRLIKEKIYALGKVWGGFLVRKLYKEEYAE